MFEAIEVTIRRLFLILILAISLTACSVQGISENELVASATPITGPEVTTDVTSMAEPMATAERQPTATTTPESTPIMTPTITPSPTSSPTPGVMLRAECPRLIKEAQLSMWSSGSILFNTGKIGEGALWWPQVEQEGIWAISAGNSEAKLAYQPANHITVSPDGKTLTVFKPNPEGTAPTITFYSTVSDESIVVSIPPPVVGEVVEEQYPSWLPDGRIRVALRLDRVLGVGETWEIFTVDPETQTVERSTLELNLPEYEFFEYDAERGVPSGFVAIDPTYQRVLYTAGDSRHHEVRLLNLDTGEILWRGHTTSLISTFPEWSVNGDSVLFMIGEPIPGTSYAWSKIVSLTREGVEEELPPQPFPGTESFIANISRSPDGRFIFYSLYSYETDQLHGYVIDTLTWEAGDVCDPNHKLLGSLPYDKVEVDWLPEGQLVYRVLIEEDGQSAHSLRVLEIPSWRTQVIFEAEPGYGVNIFGWTPAEFSEP